MIAHLLQIVSRLRRVGDRAEDDDDLLLRKHAFALTAVVVLVAAALWALLGVVSDRPGLLVASIAFAVVDVALLVAFARSGAFRRVVEPLLGAGLVYVVAAHLALGGLESSGASLTWGLLAPVLGVLLFNRASGVRWFVVYLALVVLAIALDPIVRPSVSASTSTDVVFTAFNLLGPGAIIVLLVTFVDGDRAAARRDYRNLLFEMVPPSIAHRLRAGEHPIAEQYASATVLFADLVDFTAFAEHAKARDVLLVLNDLFTAFDVLAKRFGVEKVKTMGDAYMAVAGAPIAREGHADAAVQLAIAMQREVTRRATLRARGVVLRIGIASGPMSGGVLGRHKYAWDLWGDVVNLASRMESTGIPGQIQLTVETADALTGDYRLTRRHSVAVQGKGEMTTYLLNPKRIRREGVPHTDLEAVPRSDARWPTVTGESRHFELDGVTS